MSAVWNQGGRPSAAPFLSQFHSPPHRCSVLGCKKPRPCRRSRGKMFPSPWPWAHRTRSWLQRRGTALPQCAGRTVFAAEGADFIPLPGQTASASLGSVTWEWQNVNGGCCCGSLLQHGVSCACSEYEANWRFLTGDSQPHELICAPISATNCNFWLQ